MLKWFVLAGLSVFGLITATAQLPRTQTLTVALPLAEDTADAPGCYFADALSDPGAKAYAEHLQSRFSNRIELCLTVDTSEAAALANSGDATLAWIGQDDAETLGENWRSFLTLRAHDNLGRPPYVLFQANGSNGAEDRNQKQIGLVAGKPERLFVGMALQTLGDHGLSVEGVDVDQRFVAADELFSAVRTQSVDLGILDANTWGRNCGVLEPAYNPCSDLEVIFQERPRADYAMMIENSQSLEFRYRLVSVHIALHIEAPEAFDWINQGRGTEFQAAEFNALMPRPNMGPGAN